MLKKTNRIKKKRDFNKIFKEGKGFRGDFFSLKIARNDFNCTRFGFVVSKKISKNSTTRNKIKRILSEIIRKNLPKIKDGVDIVMVIRKDFSKQKKEEILRAVEISLKKCSLLKR